MDSVCGKYEYMVEFDIYLPDGFLEWDGNFAVPIFYVPPYDEYEIDSVYAYDADEVQYSFPSLIEHPDFITLGIEGREKNYNNINYLNVIRENNPDDFYFPLGENDKYVVVRMKKLILFDDRSPGFDGASEIYFKIGYRKLMWRFVWPWGWIFGWSNTMYFFSRNPLSTGDIEVQYAPNDDEWDIFADIDSKGIFTYPDEDHYEDIHRVTFSPNYDSIKIVLVEIWGKDGFLNLDDFILSENPDYYEDEEKEYEWMNNYAFLKLLIRPENHSNSWDPDRFNHD